MKRKKFNALDIIFIVFFVVIGMLTALKLSERQNSPISISGENKKVHMEILLTENKGFYDVIKVGDRLSDIKNDLDMYVTDKKVFPYVRKGLDENGNVVTSQDPLQDQCLVTVEGKLPCKNGVYKLGSNEARAGKFVFLESKFYAYKAQVQTMRLMDNE